MHKVSLINAYQLPLPVSYRQQYTRQSFAHRLRQEACCQLIQGTHCHYGRSVVAANFTRVPQPCVLCELPAALLSALVPLSLA